MMKSNQQSKIDKVATTAILVSLFLHAYIPRHWNPPLLLRHQL